MEYLSCCKAITVELKTFGLVAVALNIRFGDTDNHRVDGPLARSFADCGLVLVGFSRSMSTVLLSSVELRRFRFLFDYVATRLLLQRDQA
jgi:hypothetical protein